MGYNNMDIILVKYMYIYLFQIGNLVIMLDREELLISRGNRFRWISDTGVTFSKCMSWLLCRHFSFSSKTVEVLG